MTEPTKEDFEREDFHAQTIWATATPSKFYMLARCYLALRQREARREELERAPRARLGRWLALSSSHGFSVFPREEEDGPGFVCQLFDRKNDRSSVAQGVTETQDEDSAIAAAMDALEAK